MAKCAKLNNDRDFISSLPDEIITYILSFIPTQSAVATSVLSKRWNDLWTSVPNLDFTCNLRFDQFDDFVDRVLALNNVLCVRAIRLEYPDIHRVNSWISSIAKREAEVMDLKLSSCLGYTLPDSFFKKNNLVELELSIWSCKVPQLVCFPNLKTIRLDSFSFDDESSMKNLLLGCPVLENLYIEISMYGYAHKYDICSSTLHVLRLRSNCQSGSRFVVDTPNLKVLELVERGGASYNMINVSSLEKLHLRLDRNDVNPFGFLTNLPMFHNLIHLTIDITRKERWECIPGLLHHAPGLVTFVVLSGHYLIPSAWCDPNKVPHCFLSCLENVEISVCLEDHSQAEMMMMIKYVLKNTNVLKKLSIRMFYANPVGNKEKFFVRTLLNLPRSSIACQIYFQGVVI